MKPILVSRVLLPALLLWPTSTLGDPLPSWNDGDAKRTIVAFVERVTTVGGPDFVAPEHRIAVFDNDGTLWTEQPIYNQLQFAFDRIRALAPEHPEWKGQQPFQAVLEGDRDALLASGKQGLLQLIAATHAGMTTAEFEAIAVDWLAKARHPRFDRPYPEVIYQPMIELLEHLRANEFATWIVSGGGVDFMRPFTERAYGIPRAQVVGTTIKTRFELRDGVPVLLRLPEIDFIDDKEGKPVAIDRIIGRRPIAAFGNSDGDHAMLQWVTAGAGPRLGAIVHHTDAEREWAYDRESHIGRLDAALDAAKSGAFTLIDMKRDWRVLFGFETPATD